MIFSEGERPSDVPYAFEWIKGDPTKESELEKACISYASALYYCWKSKCASTNLRCTNHLDHLYNRAPTSKNNPLPKQEKIESILPQKFSMLKMSFTPRQLVPMKLSKVQNWALH